MTPVKTDSKPTIISRDLTLLHPIFLDSVNEVMHQMAQESIPLQPFECYRTPQRQAYLYAQGRSRPGKLVTNAQPWQSFHQYGLAVDFVLFINNQWSWDTSGEKKYWWDRLREVGEMYGLRGLDTELSHLEFAAASLDDLTKAVFPSGGDKLWWDNLQANLTGWKGSPSAPTPAIIVRP